MLTLIVFALVVLVVLFDFIPSRKDRTKKATVLYIILSVFALGVLVMYSVGVQVPGPSDAIKQAVESIFMLSP